METEKFVEKLLNEGLELLSSEKKQKQKKGSATLRAASGLGSRKDRTAPPLILQPIQTPCHSGTPDTGRPDYADGRPLHLISYFYTNLCLVGTERATRAG